MSGTVIAQAISYLIAPILTRLYTTSEMGELAFYMRLIGFISAIATLRYEAALPLPKNDSHSFLLYRLAYLISLVILLIVAVGPPITSMQWEAGRSRPRFVTCPAWAA